MGRGGLESPLDLDGVDGEPGDFSANASSLVAEACGVVVSILAGLLPAARLSVSAEGFGESAVGDLGAPPHCDINDRTACARYVSCFGFHVKGKGEARDCASERRHEPRFLETDLLHVLTSRARHDGWTARTRL